MDLDQDMFTDDDYLPKGAHDQMVEATHQSLGPADFEPSHDVSQFVSLDTPPSSQLAPYLLENLPVDTILRSDDDDDDAGMDAT